MSGGSLNYLFTSDVSELASCRDEDIETAVARLRELGHEPVAAEIEAIVAGMRAAMASANARLDRLRPVLKAVEWNLSCDWGEDAIHDEIASMPAVP